MQISPPAPPEASAEGEGAGKPAAKKARIGGGASGSDKHEEPMPLSPRLRQASPGSSPLLSPAPGMPLPCLSPTLRGVGSGVSTHQLVRRKTNISTPQFRRLPDANMEAVPKKMTSKHYVAALNLSLQDALDVVEYDMDREDERWLTQQNEAAAEGVKRLSEDVFEIIINCLEKQTVLRRDREEQGLVTSEHAREVLLPTLKRLCGGTEEMAAHILGLWLDQVYAHWTARRAAAHGRTRGGGGLLRWEQPKEISEHAAQNHYPQPTESSATQPQAPVPSGHRRLSQQRRDRSTPQWGSQHRVIDGLDKLLPRCDMVLLHKGSDWLASSTAASVTTRPFEKPEPAAPEPAEPEGEAPRNPEAVRGLARRFDSERRARREAETKLKRLRQHTTEELQTLRRKMDSKLDEHENMLSAIESNLDKLAEEEAALRRRLDGERKKYELEHRKYEAERRARQQREADMERERKRQSRERCSLEKRLENEMSRSSHADVNSKIAIERKLLGDAVSKVVTQVSSHAEDSLNLGKQHLDRLAVNRKPSRALGSLVGEVQAEFDVWYALRMKHYEQQVPTSAAVPEASAPEAPPATNSGPESAAANSKTKVATKSGQEVLVKPEAAQAEASLVTQ